MKMLEIVFKEMSQEDYNKSLDVILADRYEIVLGEAEKAELATLARQAREQGFAPADLAEIVSENFETEVE